MSDWTADAADTVEQVVATVRDRTVVPARAAAKAVVYGLLVGFFVSVALILFAVGTFRFLDIWIPAGVWASYLIVGGILVIGGVLAWTKRGAPPARSSKES